MFVIFRFHTIPSLQTGLLPDSGFFPWIYHNTNSTRSRSSGYYLSLTISTPHDPDVSDTPEGDSGPLSDMTNLTFQPDCPDSFPSRVRGSGCRLFPKEI